ncbi:mechanosensitive ion channel family protein [Halarchaeum sp. P4]|uniref:mechanosensitive ion channel family protein n=1 Tax=Halarchaeum sp. P4 TaxID=3421639 RepID=UPI003EB9B3EE
MWGVSDVITSSQGALVRIGAFVVAAAAVGVVGRYLAVPAVAHAVRVRNTDNPALVRAVRSYARVVVVAVAFLAGLVAAGFGAVLTKSAVVAAAASVVIGVAGRETLGNVVAGAFLVADPDFGVGDHIAWNNREGSVEAVDFRVTRVRTTADEVVTVPNSTLATAEIRNPYSRGRYRLTEEVEVRPRDVERASEILRETAAADDRVLDDPAPSVSASGFGESRVALSVLLWVGDPDHGAVWEVKDSFHRRVAERFAESDITLNPPKGRTVTLRTGDAHPIVDALTRERAP